MDSLSATPLPARQRCPIRPGQKIRVLVVDDSVVIRRLVAHALSQDPALEVVGSAANGQIALQRIPQLNPDVLTLDVEMPEMNGLETLREIRKLYPTLCVIMFSTLTERGASTTLDALMLGADDYVTKASNVGSLDQSLARLREELVPKIKHLFRWESALATPQPTAIRLTPRPPLRVASLAPPIRRKVVAIGVSTGGPNALAEIIPQFPRNFPLPVVIVQHMPPLFTKMLAERLQSKANLPVTEGAQGMMLEPGKVVIAPGDFHMRLVRRGDQVQISLDQGPPENSCRPAVDVLFRSVSEIYGGAVVAAVLTGMGQDGLRGVERLKAEGAYIIAQDEPSSVVWGMPGAVVSRGLADCILDLKSVVPEILKKIG
jgi:two-component system chemotaxis response regulator CheB